MRFSLEHLEAFVTAVDAGSFSAAARELGKVQSQVSTAIASLEDDLGVDLFDRSGKYPKLTPQGEELLFKSRELLRHSGNLVSHADRLAFGEQTTLRLALDELVPIRIASQVLATFAQTWPDIELEVLWGAMGEVQRIVQSGRADIGVDMPVDDITRSGLAFRQLARADFCGVASAGHPLAAEQSPDRALLRQYTQAMGTSHRGTRLPDTFRLGDRVWLCEDSRLMRELALAGTVWTALPRYLVAEDLAAGRLVELPVPLGESEVDSVFHCVWNNNHEPTPAENWLADTLGQRLRAACGM